jgi:hypothetical protein
MKISDDAKQSKRIVLVTSGILIFVTVVVLLYIRFVISPPHLPPVSLEKGSVDRFGTLQIYPTVQGGREWFINMRDPFGDKIVSINSDTSVIHQSDGSWRVNGSKVRIRVETPLGEEEWKNVEMTGYVKILSRISITDNNKFSSQSDGDEDEDSLDPHLTWRARGGRHNGMIPCEGTALNGGIDIYGKVAWKKEIWHTGGYTDAHGVSEIPGSIMNKWIGWKTIMYNIENNSAVKMESYIDMDANNNWIKASEVEDQGGWYADTSDEIFHSANCGREKDYIVTNSGPIATFRADNLIFDFKNLSIREIQPSA